MLGKATTLSGLSRPIQYPRMFCLDYCQLTSRVSFAQQAETNLRLLLPKLKFYDRYDDIKALIHEMVQQDPRPLHYRQGKYGEIFGFAVDRLNILCKFGPSPTEVEIVDVEDWSSHPSILAAYPTKCFS